MADPRYSITGYEYLEARITICNLGDCLLWPFKIDRDGYGRVRLPKHIDSRRLTVAAHRLAFKLTRGHWPEPMGLHTCDNPTCYNPHHIYEGTDQDNKDDQKDRERTTRGSQQRDAKLTEDMVIAARKEYAAGKGTITFKGLARKYGVSGCCMRWAITGESWSHVPDPIAYIEPPAWTLPKFCRHGHLLEGNCYLYPPTSWTCKTCLHESDLRRREQVRLRKEAGTQ